MIRFPGPLRWEVDPPIGDPLPPPPPGYVTPEELTARIQQHNQDPDDQKWGSVEDLKDQAKESNLDDITHFLGPIRAVVLFYGGRMRQGDVAHCCELSIARRAIEGFRLIVCVVDIVHGLNHDISRGVAFFVWDQVKGGRVAASGVPPPQCETFAILRWADMGWHSRTNPVPLRSAFELWGRHDLTPREQRQVHTSNVLPIYAIAFEILSAIYGIANWPEHPDLISRHAWLSAPSIWITEQFR